MRELEPIERLLVDLVNDDYKRNCLEEDLRKSDEALPLANKRALVRIVEGLLGKKMANAIFRHYHIDGVDAEEEVDPATDERAYLDGMDKLRNSNRPKHWDYFGLPFERLRKEQRLFGKEINNYKRLILEDEDQLESVKFVWDFLAIFQ